MECKVPDGRYLMRHRYQWWAVYHVLVGSAASLTGTANLWPISRSSSPKGFRYWFNDEENAEINLRTSYLCVQRVHPASCFSNLFTK